MGCITYKSGIYKGITICTPHGEGPGQGPIWIWRPTGWQPISSTASREPGIYPELMLDFSVISFIHGVAGNIVDPAVRDAMKKGAEAAAQVLKERGGPDIASISFEERKQGTSA
jgi:hypothetical protein